MFAVLFVVFGLIFARGMWLGTKDKELVAVILCLIADPFCGHGMIVVALCWMGFSLVREWKQGTDSQRA